MAEKRKQPRPERGKKYIGAGRDNPKSDKYLSPSQPYTGDGKTTRKIFDRVINIFKNS